RNILNFQLISIAIDLVHKVLSITDCNPDLINDRHVSKAIDVAHKWNELFIDNIVGTKEGV
ncbi:MAG TPA: hypothetical protein VKR58_09965, partial [Aquella sp.]|nr:hypothetical protein [Aquella sp.]